MPVHGLRLRRAHLYTCATSRAHGLFYYGLLAYQVLDEGRSSPAADTQRCAPPDIEVPCDKILQLPAQYLDLVLVICAQARLFSAVRSVQTQDSN
jgi:hypothetical protein